MNRSNQQRQQCHMPFLQRLGLKKTTSFWILFWHILTTLNERKTNWPRVDITCIIYTYIHILYNVLMSLQILDCFPSFRFGSLSLNLHGYPKQKKTSAPATAALFVSLLQSGWGREAHLSSLPGSKVGGALDRSSLWGYEEYSSSIGAYAGYIFSAIPSTYIVL